MYDAWKARYLIPAGTEPDGHPRYRVEHGDDATVSEGQGYGMILAAYMAGHDPEAQTVFDGLWEFALDHPSIYDGRLMDWYVRGDEQPDTVGDDSAFDGDCDMAYALLLAQRQWGDGGRFDYGAEAARVLAGVMASTIGPQSHLPLLGDWVNGDDDYTQWTPRTSDFMPDHFRSVAAVTGDPAWTAVADACLATVAQVQQDYSPATGLLPDFLVPVTPGGPPLQPAPSWFLEGPDDGRYDYNACRDPWRLATAFLVQGDTLAGGQARRMARWLHTATGGDPALVRAGYDLDGDVQPDGDYFTTAFAAPFAVACMTDPALQSFLNALYDSIVDSHEDYYEDSLTALCLIVLSGDWWAPEQTTVAAPTPPPAVHLDLPRPNPFNAAVCLSFRLATAAPVRLAIVDAAGRRVRRLLDGELPAGRHAVTWRGRDDRGRRCAGGVYTAVLESGGGSERRRIVLVP